MKHFLSSINDALAAQRTYFAESGPEIAMRNLAFMRTASILVIAIYVLFLVCTAIFFPQWLISPFYCSIILVYVFFLLLSRRIMLHSQRLVRSALRATLSMYAATMAVAIVLSVFPHPDVPSVYFPLFLLVGPVMFILPVGWQLLITLLGSAVFFTLVIVYKSPTCWNHELFEASTSLILSLGIIILMTQLRVQSEALKNKYFALSRQDGLTGMLNKEAGLASGAAYLREKPAGEGFAVLFLDIDDFKRINDTLGHMEGDLRLREVGKALRAACRKNDIVCRFGGDEFMLLLKDVAGADAAMRKAGSVLEAVSAAAGESGSGITCSIGVCYAASGSGAVEDFIRRADQALYKAKENGKNSCALLTL